MKNCNKLFALALAALTLAACGEKASIRGTLADGAEKNVIVKQLDINVYRSIDTLKTGKDGSFRYSLQVSRSSFTCSTGTPASPPCCWKPGRPRS